VRRRLQAILMGCDHGVSCCISSRGSSFAYPRALSSLCALKERFPQPAGNIWSHTTGLLLLEWAMLRWVDSVSSWSR
jgi:hypothetical protein